MKSILCLIHFKLFAFILIAQPSIQWQKSLGGSRFEEALSIQQTYDGGYILTGYTISIDGAVSGNHGIHDFWVVKLTNNGSFEWQKALGGSNLDWPFAIRQALDGGYIVAGYTESNDENVSGNHGGKDAWVVKLNSAGDLEWQKALGGSGWDEARSIEPTSDGGYIMAGKSNSSNGDATGSHNGSLDYWVVKLSSVGAVQWQKALGGSSDDTAKSIKQTSDGGYIVTGEAFSFDGDVSSNHGNTDLWAAKLSSTGNLEWQNPLGGSGIDVGTEVNETSDGYLVCGYAGSNDGDVTGYQGLYDFWAIKLNKAGALMWQKTIGGSDADWGYTGKALSNGDFVVAGTTRSIDGDVLNNDGGQDFWVVKLNTLGEIVWQKTLGGSKGESCQSIWVTSDGGFALAGSSSSDDGDVSSNQGYPDFWVVKLAPESVGVAEAPSTQSSLDIFPNPATQSISLKIASEEPTLSVTISDLLGRAILQQNIPNGGSVDVSTLVSGSYLVLATAPSGRAFSGKLRKE